MDNPRAGSGDRVFVKDGLRSYRKTYRVAEVYWGAATFGVLIGIVGWVGWKGAHPDPALYDMSAAISGEPAPETSGAASSGSASSASRGALPAGLGDGGFMPGKIGEFSSDDLYVKINGRAGYFQSFGVRSLHAVTLAAGSSDAAASVDIELYDLGEAQNALGAYNGERPPEIAASVAEGATFHADRNAAFVARGRHYVRLIGSDESAPVLAEVRRLLELFRRELPAAAAPWGVRVLMDQLNLSPSQVSYDKSNAFSFGFARDVFRARLSPVDAADDVEAFVSAASDEAGARALARQYEEAFGSLGARAGETAAGVPLFKDEFLGTLSAATAVERWVVGMRGAAESGAVHETLSKLSAAMAALPADVRELARPSSESDMARPSTEADVARPSGESAAAPTHPEEGEDEY